VGVLVLRLYDPYTEKDVEFWPGMSDHHLRNELMTCVGLPLFSATCLTRGRSVSSRNAFRTGAAAIFS
jgi:hypothetical protein